ncbi:hypothetical protein SNE40_000652 [Patella caerulea]|uniref:Uncharacterized protein n=1 Tax=Patella caerulea TaxID=87958 RepID=A0AAN8KHJ2_PATCE
MSKFLIHPPTRLTQEATEAEKTTQEESAAELLPNSLSYAPFVEITIQDNLPNKAVSLNQAKFYADGDNIANISHEKSVTEQSYRAPSEECPDTRIQRSVASESHYKKNGLKIPDIETVMAKYCPAYVRQISINDIKFVLHERMPAIYIVYDNQRPMSHATLLRTFRNGKKPFYFDSNGGCPRNINKIVDWNRFKVQADENNTCAIHCIYVAIKLSEGKSWPEILQEYGHGNCDDKDNIVIHFLENLT